MGVRSDWARLITALKDRGIQSEHIERLRAHLNTEEQQLHLEQEIKAEIALALGRAEAKVIAALLAITLADADVDAAQDDATRARRLDERNARRREAFEARQDYKIHREAIGLRRNKHIDALFPIPGLRTE